MPTQIIHHLHYRWLPWYKKTPADRMPSQDTNFIYEQPSALVKKVLGVLKAANNWLTADGEKTLTPEYVRSMKRQTLAIKDMKTNKTKTHRECQDVGSKGGQWVRFRSFSSKITFSFYWINLIYVLWSMILWSYRPLSLFCSHLSGHMYISVPLKYLISGFSTLYFLTFNFWIFWQIQNTKASIISKLSSSNVFCMFHKVCLTKQSVQFFIFHLLFKLKIKSIIIVEIRKFRKLSFDKNIFFFLSFQDIFLKYGL